MNELSERQQSILEALVREYVRTAEPVASSLITRRHHTAASPATVRNELQVLEEAGLITQPHTSAGRVPTDRGYRYFIEHLAEREAFETAEERMLSTLRAIEEPIEFLRQVGRVLAQFTHTFAAAGLPEEELFYKTGISEVIQAPEFLDTDRVQEFGSLADRIEDELLSYFDLDDFEEPQAFVGRENPIRQTEHYGMIVASYRTPFAKRGMLALVGPKRMDYEHHLALLRQLRNILNT